MRVDAKFKGERSLGKDCVLRAMMGITAAGAASLLPSQVVAAPAGNSIRPFRINVPDEALVDLRRRLAAPVGPKRRPSRTNPRGAAGDPARARALLADRLPLAEGRGATQCPADASDAFHLVIPSLPGYGFSGKPTSTGWHYAAWEQPQLRS